MKTKETQEIQQYRTTAKSTVIPAGVLIGLSKTQYLARQQYLEATKREGIYLTKTKIEFKAGETICLSEVGDKQVAATLETVKVKSEEK